MRRGLDTTFLVQAEVLEHPGHDAAKAKVEERLGANDTLVLAPQVAAELVHIVTDANRFANPLPMAQAVARAELWWHAKEVAHALPNHDAVCLFLKWLREHQLGRKRLLDTMLAATYFCHGVRSIVSSNARDYAVFGCFKVIVP